MDNDASVMGAVAKDNPEGYALRALALREKAQRRGQKELLSKAIAEHSRAIELAPAQTRFYDERRETYMRMGEYEKALADARACIRLSPEEGIHHFHAFCALTAIGRYAEAQGEYETILGQGPSSGGDISFHWWVGAYALDLVDRHSPWRPGGPEPEGPGFTLLRRTVEAHENLAKKARRVVRQGYCPTWSPDGQELAYSRGPIGHSAIEVANLKTGTTRLLCYSGWDPAWSPDGRRIAFVRHRRAVRLQDLANGRKWYLPKEEDCEIWIVNADGTGKPRRLAKGDYPSWSRDPMRLYYYSPEEGGYLCSLSVEGDNVRPTRVIGSPGPSFIVVAPDGTRALREAVSAAQGNDAPFVELVELPSGKVSARWLGDSSNWSPDGRSVVFSRVEGRYEGVWVYDLKRGKAARVVDDWQSWELDWAPDGRQIAFSPSMQGLLTVCSDMFGTIWTTTLDDSLWKPGSSALVQDWPRDGSDPGSLWRMIVTYQKTAEGMAQAQELRRKLIEVLQQAVASGDANSIQPVERLADACLWFGQYDDVEQLYLNVRDKLRAQSGATAQSFLDLTEELVRFYLDVLNRCDRAETLCLELWKTRREVLGADSSSAIRTALVLGRIYERQKRYRDAEQIYLAILSIKPGGNLKDSVPEVYEGIQVPPAFAPLNYFQDEKSLTLRYLDDESAGVPRDKLWMICAHYLLARLYTTCPMPELHSVTKAIEHGTSACELSGWAEPFCLDALAAAYAEAGRFDLAVQRQREATLRLSGNRHWMGAVLVSRLKRYEHGIARSPQGLVARWEFEPSKDGMVADTSGNNLHGRLVGGAQVYADPERDNVLRLNGAGDYVDCGADTKFDLTDAVTIAAWIKVGKFDKPWQAVIAKGDNAWRLQRDRTTDAVEFSCTGVLPLLIPVGELNWGDLPGHTSVSDGRWHHVAGVYDGRRMNLYVDGELETFALAGAFTCIDTSPDSVRIGMNSGNSNANEWNGLIDDVRIYSYGLPPGDVKALYEGKNPPLRRE